MYETPMDPNRRTTHGKEESIQCNTSKWRPLRYAESELPSMNLRPGLTPSTLPQPLCNVSQYILATLSLLFPEWSKTLKQSILQPWCKSLRVLPRLLQQHVMSSCPVQ